MTNDEARWTLTAVILDELNAVVCTEENQAVVWFCSRETLVNINRQNLS